MVPSEERRGGLGSRRDKNSPRMIGFGKIATAKIICSTAIAADSVVWERAS